MKLDRHGDPVWPGVLKFSGEWRRRHRRWWLRRYPDADAVTRGNLTAFIDWAGAEDPAKLTNGEGA